MPLGIIEDYKLEHVPGTAPLADLGRLDTEISGVDPSMLKHDPSGKIVLVPQPSDSINDPYNWPKMKKLMFVLTFAYGCGCVGGNDALYIPVLLTKLTYLQPLAPFSAPRSSLSPQKSTSTSASSSPGSKAA
jgi:hypothetical protein